MNNVTALMFMHSLLYTHTHTLTHTDYAIDRQIVSTVSALVGIKPNSRLAYLFTSVTWPGSSIVGRKTTLPDCTFVFKSSHTRFFEVVGGFVTLGAPGCTVECSAAE